MKTKFFILLFFFSLNAFANYKIRLLGVVNMVAVDEAFVVEGSSVTWKTFGSKEESDSTLLGEFKGEVKAEILKELSLEFKKLLNNTEQFKFDSHGLSYEITKDSKVQLVNYNEPLNGVLSKVRKELKEHPVKAVGLTCNTVEKGTTCELTNMSSVETVIKNPLSVENAFFCNGLNRMKLPMLLNDQTKNSPNEIVLKAKDKFKIELNSTCPKNISLQMIEYNNEKVFAGNWVSNLLQ